MSVPIDGRAEEHVPAPFRDTETLIAAKAPRAPPSGVWANASAVVSTAAARGHAGLAGHRHRSRGQHG